MEGQGQIMHDEWKDWKAAEPFPHDECRFAQPEDEDGNGECGFRNDECRFVQKESTDVSEQCEDLHVK